MFKINKACKFPKKKKTNLKTKDNKKTQQINQLKTNQNGLSSAIQMTGTDIQEYPKQNQNI